MKKKKMLTRILSCLLTMSFVTVMTSCGDKDDKQKQIRIIGKSQQSSIYWDVVNAGASAAGEELGYNVEYIAPESEKDIDGQISLINKAVQDKVDGIVIAPINADDMNEAMQSAKDSGVSILTIDSKSSLDDMVYIGTDNYVAGTIAGTEAAKMLNESKKVAIVALNEESTLSVRWKGFEDSVASDSSINIVEKTYCNSDKETAKKQTAELIDKYPDIEMICGVNQTTTLAICETIVEKGVQGKIKVVGYDAAEPEVEYINQGVLTGTVVQNPYNIGYLGVKNVADMADGKSISKIIDTGTTFVTADNINDEAIQLLIYPMGK